MKLEKEYNQDGDESKAFPCPDLRCGLSFDSVDALRYHCQDTLCINLLKFSPRGSTISRAIAKEDPESESLLKGSDDKTQVAQVGFVNETVEGISSRCIKRSVPKDGSGIKRKRGRPQKRCGVSSTAPPPIISTNEPGGERKRGRPRKRCSEPPLPSVPQGKLGDKRKRGRPRKRYRASSTASSSCSTSPQSRAVQDLDSESELEASDDESQSESDYEMVELSASTIPQETYSASKMRKGNLWSTSSAASSSPSTATPSTSAGSSRRSLRYSITPRTSITSTPCSESYWNHKPSKSVAATPQVVIYV
jgi:hypothetical protein